MLGGNTSFNRFSVSNIKAQYHYGFNSQPRVVIFTLDKSIRVSTTDIFLEDVLEQELEIRNIIVCNPCKRRN